MTAQTTLNSAVHSLLIEACQRYTRFHAGEDLCKAWTGLGTAPVYKQALTQGYMEWVSGPPSRRQVLWLRLTVKGALIVAYWMGKGFNYNVIESGLLPDAQVPNFTGGA